MEKEARWRQYQAGLDYVRGKHPEYSQAAAWAEVAQTHGVSPKTIQRHTTWK
jgi:hypothetical protein